CSWAPASSSPGTPPSAPRRSSRRRPSTTIRRRSPTSPVASARPWSASTSTTSPSRTGSPSGAGDPPVAKIEDILEIERIDRDLYRGPAIRTHLQRTFGGQVAGQTLVAAVRTVDSDKHVHSLHGYFIRPGIPDVPTVFQVD